MEIFSEIARWIGEYETLLSGGAALVVMLGFVASPLGAGLRRLVGLRAETSAEVPMPAAADIAPPPEPESDRPSVAVMPFVSVSKDEDSEIFADGMTNDIVTALAHVPGFFVTSSNSTFVYKGQKVDTRQIGRELGVRYVVEGRVQSVGNDVRISAELVEAGSGDQLWSQQFSGDLSDIFALQDEVARSVVAQLQPELMQAEWRRGSRTPTENLDAWTLLHSARMRFLMGHGRDAVEEAIRLAETALEKDPDYADAHGFLVMAILNRLLIRWSDDPTGDQERCESHCRRALELNPESPNVLYGAAYLSLTVGDGPTAMEQIDRCCGINPNDAFAQATRALILGMVERREDGLEAADLALRLSPRDPRTYYMLAFIAYLSVMFEQYDDAEQIILRSLRQNGGYFWSLWMYALVLAMQGREAESRVALLKLLRVAPDFELEDLEEMFKTWHGHPTGERGALIDSWIDSLRAVWPT